MGWVMMSKRDIQRIEVLSEVVSGRRTVVAAASVLAITPRHVHRLLRRLQAGGGAALAHKARGRPSNNRIAAGVRDYALALVREQYADFGPTLAAEMLAQRHGLMVSRETLRSWMAEAGLWLSRKQRRRFHQPRLRRESLGELVQIDGSEHRWFEGRGDPCTLLVFIDDATGRLMQLHFVASESTAAYFAALRGYLEAHGRPVAFYSDKHTVFRVAKADAKGGQGMTQFGRALAELNIDILCADTPQAKGRVERVNRTLQDRLVKELRLAGIANVDEANAFLPGFIERFNVRFAVSPARPGDLHRSLDLSPGRLDDILCHRELRHVGQQLTLAYERKLFILTRNGVTEAIAGEYVEVYDYADDRLDIRWRGHSLPYSVFDKAQRVGQGEVVENKRLGAALAFVKARQDLQRPPPRVRTNSEAGGYHARPRRRAGPLSAAQPSQHPPSGASP